MTQYFLDKEQLKLITLQTLHFICNKRIKFRMRHNTFSSEHAKIIKREKKYITILKITII